MASEGSTGENWGDSSSCLWQSQNDNRNRKSQQLTPFFSVALWNVISPKAVGPSPAIQ